MTDDQGTEATVVIPPAAPAPEAAPQTTGDEEVRANGGFPEGYVAAEDKGPERPEDSIDLFPEGFEQPELSAEEN